MSRGGRTALALVGVAVLIGAATLVRGWLDGGGHPPPPPPGDRATLLCAKELGTVCDRIKERGGVEVVVEPAETTAKRLETVSDLGHVDADGWLTIAAQPSIVNDAQHREQREAVFGPDETIARSPLVFVVAKERKSALADQCQPAGQLDWTCIADVTDHEWSDLGGDPGWGKVEAGHADPARDTVGLLALGQQASNKLGRSNFSYADVHDEAFSSWLLDLKRREKHDDGEGPLAPMLRFGAGIDVAQVTEAEACSELRGAAQAKQLSVVVPTPVSSADVVFAPVRRGKKTDDARGAATSATSRAALRDAGWRTGDDTARRAVCAQVGPVGLEQSNHVPESGGLTALRDLWEGSG